MFNKIATYNKLPTIFPEDIKKTKLSPEILEQIFKEFSFKYTTKASSPLKILKDIYNVYFAKQVVMTEYGDNNNVSYNVNEVCKEYYVFAKQYMLLDKETRMTFNNCQTIDEQETPCEF